MRPTNFASPAPSSSVIKNATLLISTRCATVGAMCVGEATPATWRGIRKFALRSCVAVGALLLAAMTTAQAQSLIQVPSIITYAGTGSLTAGQINTGDGGLATAAGLNNPKGLVFDSKGNTYIADSGNNRIRVVNAQGIISAAYGSAAGTACANQTANTGACGDGGPISAATFVGPSGMAFDSLGNLYIADQSADRLRKVTAVNGVILPTSIITTVAGTGAGASNGDGGLATAAATYQPHVILPLPNGDIYFAEQLGCVIRYIPAVAGKVILNGVSTTTVAGHIYTVVGQDGKCGYVSDASGTLQGTQTQLNAPEGIVLSPAGNLLIADSANERIRQWNPKTGVVTTVVGSAAICPVGTPTQAGYVKNACGDGGTPAAATLGGPKGLTYDLSGNLIIGDSAGARLRSVNPAFTVITTLAGTGQQCTNQAQTTTNVAYPTCGDGGPAATALISYPIVVATNAQGSILYVDQYNNKVREILQNTVFPNTNDGATSTAQNVILQATAPITITSYSIPVSSAGVPEYIIGTVTGCTAGSAVATNTYCTVPVQFNPAYSGSQPQPLTVVTSAGTYYFNLNGVGVGPQAVLSPGTLSTVAGTANGTITGAALTTPTHSIVDTQGNLYIADTAANVVRKVTGGTATIVAGTGTACATPTAAPACGDGGLATAATLNAPTSVTTDAAGNLYISDSKDNRVRKVDATTGIITTVAGNGAAAFTGDGVAATATAIGTPVATAIDTNGDLYIVSKTDNAVRYVPSGGGLISTFAGTNGTACATATATPACGDGNLATAATLNAPTDIAIDAVGNVFIADTGDNRIRRVTDQTNVITTVAGSGVAGYAGDGAVATSARLSAPTGVALDPAGDIYIADSVNAVVREVLANGNIYTLAGNGTACATPTGVCGDGGADNVAAFITPTGVDLDILGNLFVTDSGESRVRKAVVNPISLAFASTPVFTTSADSPKTAYLQNIGNGTLTLSQPTAGTNPSISAPFTEGNSQTCPQLTNATSPLTAGAQCSYVLSFSPTTAGNYTGQLVETDNSKNVTGTTQTINLTGTATPSAPQSTLTANPSPSTYGTPVTLTETITPLNGTTCPTGPATFFSNNNQIGTGPIALVNGNCVATLVTANLPVGTDSLTATVPASNGFAATSTGPTNEVVNVAPVTNGTTPALSDTISASPNPQTFGQSVALNFSVLVAANNAAPTGSVTFTTPINGTTTTLGTAAVTLASTGVTTVINGITYTTYTATTSTTALPPGANTVTGTYTGDTNYAGGPLTTPETINNAPPVSALTASLNPSTYGTPVTLTETITPINGVCPAGPATFLNGGNSIGTGPIALTGGSCVATLVTSNLPVGTDMLTATVPASNGFAATNSALTEVVNKAPVTNPTTPALSDTIAASPNPQIIGQPVALSFSVLAAAGDAAPTGSVTFTGPVNGATTTLNTTPATFTAGGTTVINGVTYTVYTATATTSALQAGADTVTGTYTGDGNYAGGPLSTVEQINATSPPASLAVAPSPSTFGSPVMIVETVTPVNGVCPVGPVTFLNNGTQIGTSPITLTNGSCVASINPSNLPVGSDSITATIPADANFNAITSGPQSLVVNKANGADTLTSNPNPSTANQAVTLTDTVPTALAGTVPTGTVNFYSYGTLIGTGTLNASGVATLTTSTLALGTDALTAVYQGDANYAQVTSNTVNQVVNAISPNPTLSAAPNPTTFGTLVTVQETIPVVNGVAPTGTVTFFYNGTQIGTGQLTVQGTGPNAVAVASTTTSTLPVGADALTASYPGDANYAAVNSNGSVTVNKAIGPDTLSSSLNPATFGSSVTFTDTIPTVGGVAATGTVTFFDNGTQIGTGTIANGVATYTTTTLTVATHPITATYGGDANYGQVTSNTVNEVVTNTISQPALSANPNPTTFGTTVTLSETIPGINGVAPTGTVQFFYNGTLIGTGTVTNGVATTTTSTLPIGTDPVTATYSGDTNYATANSSTNVTINKSALPDTVTATPTSSNFGTPVTLTFTVPVVNGVAPTGVVSFYNGTTLLGTGNVNAQGIATLSTSALPVGSDTITAQYPGDNTYTAQNPTTTATVNNASGNAGLTVNPTSSTFGAPVTLTETIAPINGVCPTGPATFLNNGTSIGTGAIALTGSPAACVATLVTSTLPVGTDMLTATVPASNGFAATNSGPVSLVVGKATGPDTVTATPNSSVSGTPVTLTFTVPVVNGVTPTGTVSFYNGTTLLGTGNVNAQGIATLATSALTVGTDTITAQYPGDNNYAAANPTTTAVVSLSSPPASLAVAPNPSTFGSPVMIVETVTPVNGVCPVGPVTFLNNGTQIGTSPITLTNGSCVASINPSNLPVGSDSITATIPADANFNAITSGPQSLVVNKANGADTLTSNPNPSTANQAVTLTDTVPTALAGTVPTGTVNFYSYGTLIGTGTLNASGVATLTTSTLALGTDALTAVYQGDANYAQVTSNTVNQVVNAISPNPTLSAAPNPTTFGTLVTVQETIPVVNGVAPTGTVTFFYNGTQIGTGQLTVQGTGPNAVAVASTTTSTLPVGADALTASYPGDANYAAVNSNGSVTVNKAIGPDTLSSSLNPATFGSSVTFTDTIPTVGGVAATGTVTFFDNGTQIGTGTIANGVATYTTTTLTVATHPITATYGGDANYGQVTSNTVNEVVTNTISQPALSANPNPTTFGTTVTLSETIPGINGVAPTGTVQFFYNGTLIGTGTVTNGVATTTTSTLPIGTDPVTATYSGDTNYATANSSTNVTINKSALPDTVTATPTSSNFGTPVTLTFTVPVVNGVAPTGVVSFYNGTTLLGTGNVNAQGIATLSTSALPVGSDTITAQYPGDNTYTAQNPTTTATVNNASGNAGLTVNPTSSTFGAPVTLTETIAPINGVCPTGPATFLNNGTSIGTGAIALTGSPAACVATLVTSTLPVGTDMLTATVPASNGFAATNSGPVSLVVNQMPFGVMDTLSTSNAAPQLGQPVTLTFTIPTINGVIPTGTVSFYNGTTLLGTATVNAQGVATLTTSSLPAGTTTVNAVYSGDGVYAGGTLAVIEKVAQNDFSIAATPATQTINPGDTVVYTVSLSGVSGPFTSPVTLTATGLPADATVTFGTPTYVPGAGPTPTSMTIVTSPLHAKVEPSGIGSNIFYGLLLLPLLGVRRLRRKIRSLPRGIIYGLAALMMLGGFGAITGCAGGYFGPAGAQYTITVTGTSGTLVHSTTVKLTVR